MIASANSRGGPIPDHLCEVCRQPCGFGQGFDAQAKWYCRAHLPPDYAAALAARAGRFIPAPTEPKTASPAPPAPSMAASTTCTPARAQVTETPKPPPAPARVEITSRAKPEKPKDPNQGSLF